MPFLKLILYNYSAKKKVEVITTYLIYATESIFSSMLMHFINNSFRYTSYNRNYVFSKKVS
jgi:hypothetical protein